MIWNSSAGWGMRPVSSFDQTGTSFSEISNAPDCTSWPSRMLHRKNSIMQAYTLFSVHQTHQPGRGWLMYSKMLTPPKMHTITASFSKPCNRGTVWWVAGSECEWDVLISEKGTCSGRLVRSASRRRGCRGTFGWLSPRIGRTFYGSRRSNWNRGEWVRGDVGNWWLYQYRNFNVGERSFCPIFDAGESSAFEFELNTNKSTVHKMIEHQNVYTLLNWIIFLIFDISWLVLAEIQVRFEGFEVVVWTERILAIEGRKQEDHFYVKLLTLIKRI